MKYKFAKKKQQCELNSLPDRLCKSLNTFLLAILTLIVSQSNHDTCSKLMINKAV